MTDYTAYLYITIPDDDRTHIAAQVAGRDGWVIVCELLAFTGTVTYAPTDPLCLTCAHKTWQPHHTNEPVTPR